MVFSFCATVPIGKCVMAVTNGIIRRQLIESFWMSEPIYFTSQHRQLENCCLCMQIVQADWHGQM